MTLSCHKHLPLAVFKSELNFLLGGDSPVKIANPMRWQLHVRYSVVLRYLCATGAASYDRNYRSFHQTSNMNIEAD